LISRDSRSTEAPSGADAGNTRRRFLLARAQCTAHVPAAEYLRIRELYRLAQVRTRPAR
jgi:hypothetical protein